MRTPLFALALFALAACSPQPQQQAPDEPRAESPAPAACNDVAPNPARLVSVTDAFATAGAIDLRGGRIAPGAYDLVAATRVGAATGWNGPRAITIVVTEEDSGAVSLAWAGVTTGGVFDRWNATLTETPTPRLTYTCGRMGVVEASFAASSEGLHLRLPDGGAGALDLAFEPRR